MAKVFISYSRKDIEFAKKLTTELQKSELDFWIDWEGIPPTVDWWKEIEKGIEEADAFLFIISPDSAKSKVCGQEIDTAAKNGKRIIPIVVREIEWQDTPPQLGHLNYIFFSRNDDFDTATQKLITAIHTDYEWAAAHRRLQVKALEWERNHKESSFLLRGKDLQDAELHLAINTSKDPFPTDLQREYVFTSRKATDRQRRNITGISIAGIIMLTILAVFGFYQAGQATNNAATAVANEQKADQQAKIAIARQLVFQAQELSQLAMGRDPFIGILLAIESMKLYPEAGAASTLFKNVHYGGFFPTFNHDDDVETVAFSPDGKYIVSGSRDNTARIWDVSTGKEIYQIKFDAWVLCVAFSPNGKYIVAGSQDRTVRVWEAISGKEIFRLSFDQSVVATAFSPDGKFVVAGSYDKTVRVLDAMNGKEVARVTHNNEFVTTVAFGLNGEYVVSGTTNDVKVWEAQSGKEIFHLNDVTAFSVSKNGKYIVSGNADKTLRVWELPNGKEITRIPMNDLATNVAIDPNGEYVVAGIGSGIEYAWRVSDGKEFGIINDNTVAKSLAFSPDGKYMLSTDLMSVAYIWEISSGAKIIQFDGNYHSAAFSPDGKYVALGGFDDAAELFEWNPKDLIEYMCKVVDRNLTRAEWQQYIGDALPYQAVCENLPIEPEVTATP